MNGARGRYSLTPCPAPASPSPRHSPTRTPGVIMTTTTAPKLKSDAQIARTKKYQALIAVGLSPEAAAKKYREVVEGAAPEPVSNPIQDLLDAGFSQEEVDAIVGAGA